MDSGEMVTQQPVSTLPDLKNDNPDTAAVVEVTLPYPADSVAFLSKHEATPALTDKELAVSKTPTATQTQDETDRTDGGGERTGKLEGNGNFERIVDGSAIADTVVVQQIKGTVEIEVDTVAPAAEAESGSHEGTVLVVSKTEQEAGLVGVVVEQSSQEGIAVEVLLSEARPTANDVQLLPLGEDDSGLVGASSNVAEIEGVQPSGQIGNAGFIVEVEAVVVVDAPPTISTTISLVDSALGAVEADVTATKELDHSAIAELEQGQDVLISGANGDDVAIVERSSVAVVRLEDGPSIDEPEFTGNSLREMADPSVGNSIPLGAAEDESAALRTVEEEAVPVAEFEGTPHVAANDVSNFNPPEQESLEAAKALDRGVDSSETAEEPLTAAGFSVDRMAGERSKISAPLKDIKDDELVDAIIDPQDVMEVPALDSSIVVELDASISPEEGKGVEHLLVAPSAVEPAGELLSSEGPLTSNEMVTSAEQNSSFVQRNASSIVVTSAFLEAEDLRKDVEDQQSVEGVAIPAVDEVAVGELARDHSNEAAPVVIDVIEVTVESVAVVIAPNDSSDNAMPDVPSTSAGELATVSESISIPAADERKEVNPGTGLGADTREEVPIVENAVPTDVEELVEDPTVTHPIVREELMEITINESSSAQSVETTRAADILGSSDDTEVAMTLVNATLSTDDTSLPDSGRTEELATGMSDKIEETAVNTETATGSLIQILADKIEDNPMEISEAVEEHPATIAFKEVITEVEEDSRIRADDPVDSVVNVTETMALGKEEDSDMVRAAPTDDAEAGGEAVTIPEPIVPEEDLVMNPPVGVVAFEETIDTTTTRTQQGNGEAITEEVDSHGVLIGVGSSVESSGLTITEIAETTVIVEELQAERQLSWSLSEPLITPPEEEIVEAIGDLADDSIVDIAPAGAEDLVLLVTEHDGKTESKDLLVTEDGAGAKSNDLGVTEDDVNRELNNLVPTEDGAKTEFSDLVIETDEINANRELRKLNTSPDEETAPSETTGIQTQTLEELSEGVGLDDMELPRQNSIDTVFATITGGEAEPLDLQDARLLTAPTSTASSMETGTAVLAGSPQMSPAENREPSDVAVAVERREVVDQGNGERAAIDEKVLPSEGERVAARQRDVVLQAGDGEVAAGGDYNNFPTLDAGSVSISMSSYDVEKLSPVDESAAVVVQQVSNVIENSGNIAEASRDDGNGSGLGLVGAVEGSEVKDMVSGEAGVDTIKSADVGGVQTGDALERNEKKRWRAEEDAVAEDEEKTAKAAKTSNGEVSPELNDAEVKNDVQVDKKRPRDEADVVSVAPDVALQTKVQKTGSDEEDAGFLSRNADTEEEADAEEDADMEDKEEAQEKNGSGQPRYKKRKISLFLGYSGAGYQGMQKNPGAITIEGELEEALFRAGAIAESNYGKPQKLDWRRAARTDKGVSAVGQVVSGCFFIDPPGFIERVNSHLPKQIRVYGYKRATASFNAKKLCDRRKYEYILPVYAFDPSVHLDRETAQARAAEEKLHAVSETKTITTVTTISGPAGETEAVADVIDSEMNERAATEEGVSVSVATDVATREMEGKADNQSCSNGVCVVTEEVTAVTETTQGNGAAGDKIQTQVVEEVVTEQKDIVMENVQTEEVPLDTKEVTAAETVVHSSPEEKEAVDEKVGIAQAEVLVQTTEVTTERVEVTFTEAAVDLGTEEKKEALDEKVKKSTYKFGDAEFNRLSRILGGFVGHHNFHNFTARTKATDPSANRYIISFGVENTLTIDGIEFVRCSVVGQSFMLHQIRKMIGLAVAIMRGTAPESILATALRRDTKINVPMAPELGLFLEECYYSAYNRRFRASHEEMSLDSFSDEVNEFKKEFIYPHIVSTEARDSTFAMWLHSLNDRHYPDFVAAREAETLAKAQ